jgi:ATP-dependent Clp protease ATP-binding subunit ClpC
MFERFTEGARRALFFARFEVSELGGPAIEAEHLLLGILRADQGPTPRLFAAAGLSYSEARAAMQARQNTRERLSTSIEIPFTDEAKHVFERAREEAARLDHRHIGNEHLLLGILHQESSFAAGLLGSHGLNVESVREYIRNQPAETPPDSATLPARGTLDPIALVERIRFLAEQLSGQETRREDAPFLLEEIHIRLDELKRRVASEQ